MKPIDNTLDRTILCEHVMCLQVPTKNIPGYYLCGLISGGARNADCPCLITDWMICDLNPHRDDKDMILKLPDLESRVRDLESRKHSKYNE